MIRPHMLLLVLWRQQLASECVHLHSAAASRSAASVKAHSTKHVQVTHLILSFCLLFVECLDVA
jgi:hypothetical protein